MNATNKSQPNNGNILLVASWESNVGYAWWLMENFWTTIDRHFKNQDKNCFLIYPKITELPQSITSSQIEASECNINDRSIANLFKLYNLIKNNSIKYIYLSDHPSYSFFYILLKIWGIKKIVVHDHSPGERTIPSHWVKTIKSFIQRIPYFTADHFIAVTDFVYRRHLEVNCIPEEKCSVASNGIQPFDLTNADLHYAQKQFNIHAECHIVVTTGRATYYKGIDFYIRCADELINNQKIETLHFIFCGDGPDMNDFQSLAKSLAVDKYFTFAGKRQDIQDILPSCHVGFHAATGEVGYSLSILEYMSSGLVTIVPDNPSTSLSINNMKNGITYKHKDIQSATNAIKYALLDGPEVETIKQNAIQSVHDKYNIKFTNKRLIEILDTIFTSK